MPGFEDVASYGEFFSPEEWDALPMAAWSEPEPAPERGGGHEVRFEPADGSRDAVALRCDACGRLAVADGRAEADAIARLHTAFVAVLVERYRTEPVRWEPDLGDLVVLRLASALEGLKDRLRSGGLDRAAGLLDELTRRCEAWLEGVGT